MTPWQFHCTSLCQEKPRTADADEARQGVQWKVTVERWQSSILGCKCSRFDFWKWKNFKTPMIRRGDVLSPCITGYSRHIPSFGSMTELGRFHFWIFLFCNWFDSGVDSIDPKWNWPRSKINPVQQLWMIQIVTTSHQSCTTRRLTNRIEKRCMVWICQHLTKIMLQTNVQYSSVIYQHQYVHSNIHSSGPPMLKSRQVKLTLRHTHPRRCSTQWWTRRLLDGLCDMLLVRDG